MLNFCTDLLNNQSLRNLMPHIYMVSGSWRNVEYIPPIDPRISSVLHCTKLKEKKKKKKKSQAKVSAKL